MERESNPMQALCRSGCGFYGNPATDGLCSLCYKEALKKKQQPPVSAPSPAASQVSTAQTLATFMETATAQPTVPCLTPATDPTVLDSVMSNDDSTANNSEEQERDVNLTDSIDTDLNANVNDTEIKINEEQHDNDDVDNNNSDLTAGINEENDSDETTNVADSNLTKSERPTDSETSFRSAKEEERDKVDNLPRIAGKKRPYPFAAEEGTSGASSVSGSSVNDPDDSFSDKDGDKDAKKKKNRCATCRKKVGLTGFQCRCGGLFCAVHRYSDKHDCSFNYREMGAQEIRRNNPVVVGEKIQKI